MAEFFIVRLVGPKLSILSRLQAVKKNGQTESDQLKSLKELGLCQCSLV